MRWKIESIKIEMDIKRPYFIAEAGVNHEGDLIRAYDMIDAAFESGADAIKFQSYKAHNLALADFHEILKSLLKPEIRKQKNLKPPNVARCISAKPLTTNIFVND